MSYLEPPRILQNPGMGVRHDHKVVCPVCRKNDAQVFFNSDPMIRTNQVFPCKECKEKQDQLEAEERKWYEQSAKGVFEHTETGEELVLDQRGRKMKNPYKNREFDRHGWLQSGHKKKYKRHLESQGKL